MTRAQEIGISNANMAFDQAYDFDNLASAIASHFENIQDSLIDEGILSDETLREAHEAFDARVADLNNA